MIDPLNACLGFIGEGIQRAQSAYFRRGNADGCDEAAQIANRRRAAHHAPACKRKYARQRHAAHDFQQRIDRRLAAQNLEVKPRTFEKPGMGPRFLIILQIIGLGDATACKAFGQHGGDLAGLLLRALGGLAQRVADADDRRKGNRVDNQDQQGQCPVEDEHSSQRTRDGEHAFHKIGGNAKGGLAHDIHVIDELRDKFAGCRRGQPRIIAFDEPGKQRILNTDQPVLNRCIVEQCLNIQRKRADDCRDNDQQGQHPDHATAGPFGQIESCNGRRFTASADAQPIHSGLDQKSIAGSSDRRDQRKQCAQHQHAPLLRHPVNQETPHQMFFGFRHRRS